MEQQSPVRVDVVIVGSGPVGSAFTRAIREQNPSTTVLMVDAGPTLTDPPGMNVRNLGMTAMADRQRAADDAVPVTVPDPHVHAPLVLARPGLKLVRSVPDSAPDQDDMPAAATATNVGGMGAHWTCAVPRPGDSEVISFIPAAEMDAAFVQAEKYLSATTKGFPTSPAAELIRQRLAERFDRPGHRPVQSMPLACEPSRDRRLPRWTGSDVVLGAELLSPDGSKGFTLADQTLCRRLLLDGTRATGVELEDLRSTTVYQVSARVVVVAADALRTPQVLWASGIRPPALGRYLNDQPQIIAAVYLHGLPAEAKATAADDNLEDLAGVSWVPFSDAHPFHVQVMQRETSPIDFDQPNRGERQPVVAVGYFCAKIADASDRVEMSGTETDEYGMPRIRLHYHLSDVDLASIDRAKQSISAVAADLGDYIPGGRPRLLPAGSSLHYQGTTRMGSTDDGTSVCDDRSKVWGYENVYVGGNGVIPTATACNPTLTSVALAIRAANDIAGRLADRSGAGEDPALSDGEASPR